MPHRQAVQFLPDVFPARQERIHQAHETGVVGGFDQVGQFMAAPVQIYQQALNKERIRGILQPFLVVFGTLQTIGS
jgi:hypothetical protein